MEDRAWRRILAWSIGLGRGRTDITYIDCDNWTKKWIISG